MAVAQVAKDAEETQPGYSWSANYYELAPIWELPSNGWQLSQRVNSLLVSVCHKCNSLVGASSMSRQQLPRTRCMGTS